MPVCFLRFGLLITAVLIFWRPAAAQTCFFSISPPSASFSASGGDGLITVTASAGTCAREVVSNNPSWITISFGQSGTGNGTAGYRVAANNTPVPRTGSISVSGQTFNISQAAGTCNFQISPNRGTVAPTGGSGSFSVTTECSWTATTTASWISLANASGSGNGTVRWTASANTTTSQRTGTIAIGSFSYTLVQDASCVFTASPTSFSFTGATGTGTISVQGASACERTATTDSSWIRITSGANGSGNGNVAFSVDANTSGGQRVGNIRINDTAVLVTQAFTACVVVLSPSRAAGGVNGGTGTFGVSATCPWTAVSRSPWLVLTGTTSGTGQGSVSYDYGANLSSIPRGGFVDVNTSTFVLDQPGASCDVELDSTSATAAADGTTESNMIRVTTIADCAWTATSAVPWISVVGRASGTGSGTVEYRVSPNPVATIRTGSLTIGNKSFIVQQAAANCNVSLGSTSAQVGAEGGSRTLAITANCSWSAQASHEWIQITSASSGTSDATLAYTVAPNASSGVRRGSITVNGQTLTIEQSGATCSLTLTPAQATVPPRGGGGSVSVTGSRACEWTAVSGADWLKVSYELVSGSGMVRYAAAANTTGAERATIISVSGQSVPVRQPPLVLSLTSQGILNAASYAGGGVAPGEIVTIYGSGFGPSELAGIQLNATGTGITSITGDTQVLFDGQAAPMIYAVEGQVSAIVPYAVAGRQATDVEVRYLGVRSNVVTIPVAAAAPGVFTLAATGRGQAAVLNQDYTLNGPEIPAARGAVLQIFATGEGQTRPAGVDGRLAAGPQLPVPVLPVRVLIGGVEARVTYAGAAPGLVAGVLQVNAQVPESVEAGTAVPIVIRVGEAESPAGPTVAIR